MKLYKQWGGGTIVENSSHGLKRNLPFLLDVAKETGVHVIAGTGHYVYGVQEPTDLQLTVEQMADLYQKEMTIGCDIGNAKDFVKCGFIGEVGSGWPIHGTSVCFNTKFYI